MQQRTLPRTAKFENLGDKIGKQQRLQWSTFVEGAVPEDERVHYSHPLNRRGDARDMVPGAYLWLPDPYQYQPLDNDFRAIRLIEVLPGPENSIIKCTMHHAMLDANYTCLSYTSSFNEEVKACQECFISVDKKRLRISRDLWSFLHFARSRHISDLFWIDEICIDSQNPAEKSQQVSLIPWIYRSASATIAWLENPNVTTGTPDLSILEYAADIAHEHEAMNSTWLSSRTAAIQTFLFLPYWWRLWTAQELLLSRDILFLTFTDECTLDAIQALFSGLTSVKRQFPDLYHAMLCSPAFNIVNNTRKLFIRHTALPLHYLMQALKFNDCAEPRDRIYGVLGLAMQGDIFEVDYREPLPELVRRAWETFRPKTRAMSKLLFADLLEALDVDSTALPFYLVSRGVFSPAAPTASQLSLLTEPSSVGHHLKLEIKDKHDGWSESEIEIGTKCFAQSCCSTPRCRPRCCAVRRWRQRHGILCQFGSSCRMISCWQV